MSLLMPASNALRWFKLLVQVMMQLPTAWQANVCQDCPKAAAPNAATVRVTLQTTQSSIPTAETHGRDTCRLVIICFCICLLHACVMKESCKAIIETAVETSIKLAMHSGYALAPLQLQHCQMYASLS